jgi:hypothetical protein
MPGANVCEPIHIADPVCLIHVDGPLTSRADAELADPSGQRCDLRGNLRHAADFVHKILKGSQPADLPVELPTRFELAVNLETAKLIGVTIPESLLIRAEEVME